MESSESRNSWNTSYSSESSESKDRPGYTTSYSYNIEDSISNPVIKTKPTLKSEKLTKLERELEELKTELEIAKIEHQLMKEIAVMKQKINTYRNPTIREGE